MDTLEELIGHIEGRFECKEGLAINRCQTGEFYVLVGRQSPNNTWAVPPGPWGYAEGAEAMSYPDERSAVEAALEAFNEYANDRSGTLYWRNCPRMGQHYDLVRVYLRLVISSQPEVYPTVDALKDALYAA